MFDFVKQMYIWGCDIKQYVVLNTITADDYKAITGESYVAPTTQATTTSTAN